MNNVMNLVNFVRGCDPREEKRDFYAPVAEKIKVDKKYGLKSTVLLQHDAYIRDDFRELMLRERGENLEVGIWLEMGRPLIEAVGLEWRGREGWDWDWHVHCGFLEGYTVEERKLIIDEAFRSFKEIFGEYPRVAGSWLLDAFSMQYMSEKYGMDAFVVCREQHSVDAYTLWGGYYNGGYYASKNNMLCPAQHKELQIDTPVFRMLGPDPIYGNCDNNKEYKLLDEKGCYTMEPCWPCGKDQKVMEWYFRNYYENPSLAMSHATTGQENGFGWRDGEHDVEKGYIIQAELIAKYRDEGKLRVETLSETGKAFKKAFPTTPASMLSAYDDWTDNNMQSVWYNCINYRANIVSKDGRVYFRDIQKFDDSVEEKYLNNVCTGWQAFYYNQPIVDRLVWSDDNKKAELAFTNAADKIEFSREISEEEAEIKVYFADGNIGFVRFDAKRIEFENCGNMNWCTGVSDAVKSIDGDTVTLCYHENTYSVKLFAGITKINENIVLTPINGKITMNVSF